VAPDGYVEMLHALEKLVKSNTAEQQGLTNVVSVPLSEEVVAVLMAIPSQMQPPASLDEASVESEMP